ncbi:ribosome biogenesis GTP-binding protein YihA/YsxC [Rugosibacter aromaticivorans]|uniref:ribosome biogenesis GTP-binding protein YihA/YsxC n=1 Tax=Rugosibacter aromaticivorans TaxID=1565605 RepID=UPI000AD09396|nr:ribosome biogenesis GTP-binding protein YihA/YsxC [Rugosibacter aromaticivorans]TBR13892.1 MAG: YihA family ribosome biogenesis GTP-binding protein [Rugosibacter sp.]
MALFRHATFEISAAKPSDLSPSLGPEIAFAGRSNAGKSSAINTLVGHTRLAFVSKTPGRTQLINLFRMKNGAALVDLPGYGFAQVPLAVRLQWQGLLEEYLIRRSNLVGLVLIMDSRRPLTELDRKMIGWFAPTGRPIHCLLTKSDKLTRQEQTKTLLDARVALAEYDAGVTVQLFSSLKKTGMEEVERIVGGWLGVQAGVETASRDEAKEKPSAIGGGIAEGEVA